MWWVNEKSGLDRPIRDFLEHRISLCSEFGRLAVDLVSQPLLQLATPSLTIVPSLLRLGQSKTMLFLHSEYLVLQMSDVVSVASALNQRRFQSLPVFSRLRVLFLDLIGKIVYPALQLSFSFLAAEDLGFQLVFTFSELFMDKMQLF